MAELSSIRADDLDKGALDLIIAPSADALLGIGGDVAADDHPRRRLIGVGQFPASGEGMAHVEGLPPARRGMAQHAIPEGREVAAVARLIVVRGFGDLGDGWSVGRRQRDFVLGPRNRVVDRRKARQIGGDRRRVVVRQIAVDDNRHGRPDDRAVGPFSVTQGGDNFRLGPGADASLAIRRDVRADDMPEILIELGAAAQLLACRDVARSVPRRVAIAAGSNRGDEIGAAFNGCFGDCAADGVSGQS